jgi:hypothetical protein
MSAAGPSLSPDILERVRRLQDRQLSPEEFGAFADAPLGADEREHTLALVRWFTRRYPSPADRLAYVRRAYARWRAARLQLLDTNGGRSSPAST